MTTIIYDKFNQPLSIGDAVIYAPAGSYGGVSVGVIEKFTPKQIGIRCISGGVGRHIDGGTDKKLFYTYSREVVKTLTKKYS